MAVQILSFRSLLTSVMFCLFSLIYYNNGFAQNAIDKPQSIKVPFSLKKGGFVTIVIEDAKGIRVKNLIADTWFNAGKNFVYWDGTDDLGRDLSSAKKGIYTIPFSLVPSGNYKAKAIVHDEINTNYEFSVYAPGNPPWSTDDHKGGWLANHTPPQAALFVPASQSPTMAPAVYLGSYVTEGPDGLAWVDLAGNKLGGKKWIGGNWIAAPYLARDASVNADPAIFAYVAAAFETQKDSKHAEIRVTGLNRGKDKNVLKYDVGSLSTGEIKDELNGFAVYGGLAVLSLPQKNKLVLLNLKTNAVLDTISLQQGGGLSFDKEGKLLVISGNRILRFEGFSKSQKFKIDRTLITTRLDRPVATAVDDNNNIYVSNRGESHQVMVFSEDGKFILAIGNPGKPKAGAYDQLHMNNPSGITIDSKQQLWVTEDDYLPKRVSVWTLKGKLINAFYGPAKYGGGGTLDNVDKSKFYYAHSSKGLMEFELDWAKGSSILKTVLYRKETEIIPLGDRSAAPETPIYFQGRRYFTNSYNSIPTGGNSTAFLFKESGGYLKPCVAMGRGDKWAVLNRPEFTPFWNRLLTGKVKKANVFFIWNDLNNDSNVQTNEISFLNGTASGVSVTADLSFAIAKMDDKAMLFSPVNFTAAGTPVYNTNKNEIIVKGVQAPASSGGNQILSGPDGWSVVTLGVLPFHRYSISGVKNGLPMWSYPNLWPGLHAAHSAPLPSFKGELIGPTRLLGDFIKNKDSGSGPLWAINSNHGMIYIFTSDGLFVTTLFQPMRSGKRWNMPLNRGANVKDISLGEENFWPSLTETSAGEVYLVDGARNSIVKVEGLKTIQRLPDIAISVVNNKVASNFNIQNPSATSTANRNEYKVLINSLPPVIDGKIDDWKDSQWVNISNTISGAISVSNNRLYAVYNTGDKELLKNSLEAPLAPFKTGGALDLMIGSSTSKNPDRDQPEPGDLRLLITIRDRKPYALIYEAKIAGNVKNDKVPFASPERTVLFDQVADVSSKITFAAKNGMYEFSIPLSSLNLNPKAGMIIIGDIGVLKGDGSQTLSRLYWSNKATSIISDVPSEAELKPGLWGHFIFY
jgi:hypothetical protein